MTPDSASSPPSESAKPNPAAPVSPVSRPVGWLAAVVLISLWAYAEYRLGTLWYASPNYTYGWFVPLLCLCLFWERWQWRPAPEPVAAATGPVIVWGVLALTLLPTCLLLEVIPYSRFAGWPFAGAIIGITFCALYLIGGRSWVHHFAFPLLFFLVAVPWPSRFEMPLIGKLSQLNAALSTWAANLLGTPAMRQGLVIETGAGMAGVDEACSGIRSFQAAVMVSLFLGELFRYTFSRRVFFLLSGVALAFGCNVVRTTYLVRVCDLQGQAALNLAHDTAGYKILGATLAGLLLLAWVFRPRQRSEVRGQRSRTAAEKESAAEFEVRTGWSELGSQEGDPANERPEGPSQPVGSGRSGVKLTGALVGLALWILAIEVGIAAWFRQAGNEAVAVNAWSLQPPSQQPGFRESPIRESIRTVLKYDEGKLAEWRDVEGRPWQVYYLRWLAARNRYRAVEAATGARTHEPVLCLTTAGMVLQKDFGSQVSQINGVTLLTNLQRFSDKGRPLHLLYCYWDSDPAALENRPASMVSTSSALRGSLRAIQVRDRARNEKSVIIMGVWGMESDAAAEAAFQELLQQAIRS